MYAITLPWEQANDVLGWAIETRAHLRVTVRLARDWTEVASQFVGGDPLHVIAVRKFPAPWTDRMLAGQLLPCSFRKGHKKYLFVSAVLNEEEMEIDGQLEPVYVLGWPEGLQQVQRRFYFRAAVPPTMPLQARVWPAMPAVDRAPADPPLGIGRLADISAGGCQILFPESCGLDVDQSYLLEVELAKPEPPVLVLAQLRRLDPCDEPGRHSYGWQFLSLDHSPRGRDTLVRLARFANYLRSLQYGEKVEQCTGDD